MQGMNRTTRKCHFGCLLCRPAEAQSHPATLAASPEAIVRLVELGDPARNIPPCAACHRAGAGGPIEAPIP